jgi:UDP-3-O-[3-hydroxymyristoyl] glucosamine N-acyltransferase
VRVSGKAEIGGDAVLTGNVLVGDRANISDRVRVNGSVFVGGDTALLGDGLINSGLDFLVVGPIGKCRDYITAHRDVVLGLRVNTGARSGPLEDFTASVEAVRNSYYYKEYKIVIELFRNRFLP